MCVQQMVFRDLIFQSEVVEQRFRAGVVTYHEPLSSANGNPKQHGRNMLPCRSHCRFHPKSSLTYNSTSYSILVNRDRYITVTGFTLLIEASASEAVGEATFASEAHAEGISYKGDTSLAVDTPLPEPKAPAQLGPSPSADGMMDPGAERASSLS